ncbi:hypothetical protein FHR83_006740 [Actinoplanes campanulatus]|uniref:Uncharacterized protein n=1 Tax=Actinoplanes campanulatus TaxID=113559 RepID=A0A7W5ANE0_9ACTN|nr:hypothetical protein [Actinoplanes campanulatus]MBB3099034.1 hypothetical protein [Actinoplanes campanulatus]GGN39341.1 hypothetical protein GCM10010109_67160 [Actinoplanes campanulatus]GID40193.1 hypothetical protein Aca09nite_66990 [Actinoplanes campanulatus]
MKVLAWFGFVLAIIGGAGLVGAGYATVVQVIAVLGVLTVIGIDIYKDKTPNQYAVIGAFVVPSLIVGMNGKATEKISDGLTSLWDWADRNLGDWVGTTTVGLALAAVVISFLVSHKAMPRGGR